MKAQFRNPNFWLMLAADAALFAVSLSLAFLVRFEFSLPPEYVDQLLGFLPFFVGLKLLTYFSLGLYRGMWRYTSFYEVWRLLQAALLSTMLLLVGIIYLQGLLGFSRAVFLIDCGLTVFLTVGLRIAIRRAFEQGSLGHILGSLFTVRGKAGGRRVLILGAGSAGEQILREMLRNENLGLAPVGFLDDDPAKRGRSVHGVPVLGPVADLAGVAEKARAEEIVIAMPRATGEEMRRVVEACETTRLPFKTLPGMASILDGRVQVSDLREVDFADLLGREQADLETARISGYLTGKVVLVTGCGGSIGSELVRQIVPFGPRLLLLMDAGEYNLYSIQMELHHKRGFTNYATVLGRVQDRALLDRVFAAHRPEVVFHAAAYKHVPLIERNPWQAVDNNVEASRVLMEAAVAHGVRRFVLVSTDKAVRPTNVMGASKRVTELLMQARTGGPTKFMAVRFGNVIGSSGSVIPLFLEQIRNGGPVTVTHPEVTRYFMTIGEAAQLILQAGAMGGDGELFLLKMGTPVRIADMARDLIRLAGKEPDRDIAIIFTGLREGEKLYEELITAGEDVVPTEHGKIMLLRADDTWHGHGSQEAYRAALDAGLDELRAAATAFDACAVKAALARLVPEYAAQEADCVLDAPAAAAKENAA